MNTGFELLHGDSREVLARFESGSIDACITDPPYGLGFMGKAWDRSGVAFERETWVAIERVLKPGAHLLAFGGTRTVHRIAVAIEEAGFEIRDQIVWLYGSGFPKSRNIGSGWGTALKPGHEPIIVARKPMIGTVAVNVAVHGTGAINVDGCRLPVEDADYAKNCSGDRGHDHNRTRQMASFTMTSGKASPVGRWPANVCLDEDAAAILDEQSGNLASGANPTRRGSNKFNATYGEFTGQPECTPARGADSGGASRFFFTVRPECWLCAGLNHGTMSATQGGETCAHVTSADSHSSQNGTINGSAESHAQPLPRRRDADKSVASSSLAITAESSARNSLETIGAIAPTNAPMPHAEQLAQRVKSAGDLCDSCATVIAQRLAATLRGRTPESLPGLGSMPSFNASTLIRNLAPFAEPWVNTDTIPTTASLSILFGSVRHAIAESTSKASRDPNTESEPMRFRYVSKASRAERNAGLEGMPERMLRWSAGEQNPGSFQSEGTNRYAANHHPTVKPIALMRWLVRLVTPTGGLVLDPFMGSGTTGIACAAEGFGFVGIEQQLDYLEIARHRIAASVRHPALLGVAL